MGATLPAIARCLNTTRSGVSRLSLFYMANLAGGAIGCLLAGFYLLRVYNIYVASAVAVLLNVAVAVSALAICSRASFRARNPASLAVPSLGAHKVVYLVIALSGLTAVDSAWVAA
jgi:spermidine synthase